MSDILDIFKKTGAIITDSHFVLTSGKHSPVYINKDIAYAHTQTASLIGQLLAKKFKSANIDIVAAPAFGGIVLSQWTAHHLSKLKKKEVLSVYTEKTPDKNQILTRGYDVLVKGKNVLVVEDLTTTGTSVRKAIISVRQAGGKVVGVGILINRNPREVDKKAITAPFYALANFPTEVFDEKNCPLCKKNVPVNTSVGHGKKYLEEKKRTTA